MEWQEYEQGDTCGSVEAAITRCMEIYQQPEETIFPSLMELLCEFYQSKTAFLYHFHHNNSRLHCIARWSEDPKLRVVKEEETQIEARLLHHWLESQSGKNVLTIGQDEENESLKTILQQYQVENLTVHPVENPEKQLVGLVGISDKKSPQGNMAFLYAVSRFVAHAVSEGQGDQLPFHRDTLTGLYNRAGYAKKIDQIMRGKPKSMGVISANINGLRYINENAGIENGDKHIKTAAKRLEKHFGFEFFRMSGDEFLGIAPNVDEEIFEEKAMSLYNDMRQENNYDFSLGHSWCNENVDVLKLAQEAEILVYINKQQYYSISKREFDSVSDTTLSDLLCSLQNEEFFIYLQPQVQLKDGSLYGAEALVRRIDKKHNKMVFPDLFIPLYEQKSVIRHLDLFVFEQVCRLQEKWIAKGYEVPVSVNFSRVTLQEYGIVDSIAETCDRYHVPHHLLVIEVTERAGLIENNVASHLVHQFKEQNFHISLDDFGCAYSNIVTLAQIEVDEVKLDKSLVDFILSNKKNLVLVKNVLSMCNELDGTATLAEGIEEEEQGKLLYSLGCHLGQGYYYSKPIPVEEFEEKYIRS